MATERSADEGPDGDADDPPVDGHDALIEPVDSHVRSTDRSAVGVGPVGRRRLLQVLGVTGVGGFAGCATVDRFLFGGDDQPEYGFGGTPTRTSTSTTAATGTSPTTTAVSSTQTSSVTSTATTRTTGSTPEGEYGLQGYGQYGYGGTR